jgi:hypothetical protein
MATTGLDILYKRGYAVHVGVVPTSHAGQGAALGWLPLLEMLTTSLYQLNRAKTIFFKKAEILLKSNNFFFKSLVSEKYRI